MNSAFPQQSMQYPSMYASNKPGQSTMFGPDGQREERRHVQSVVLNEEYIGAQAEDTVTYVEVPYIEEIIRHVPRKEIVEREKRVPKYEIEYVDRIVEIPQIQYVDKTVEVPQVHEVLRHVPKREVVEVPKEIVKHVPRIETKVVEKVVEVPGERIEVPKPYTVENKVQVPQYMDKEVPMVVAQTVKPLITETKEHLDVDVIEYEPEVIPVDIHVPKAMGTQLVAKGVVEEIHRVVSIPPAQYNSMLRYLNPHINEKDSSVLPYLTHEGKIVFLGSGEPIPQTAPISNADIIGWSGSYSARQHYVTEKHHRASPQHMGHMAHRHSTSHKSALTGSHSTLHRYYSQNDVSQTARGMGIHHRRSARKSKGACPC